MVFPASVVSVDAAHGTAATDDTSSVALHDTVTLPVYQPPAPSGPAAAPVTTGAELSRFTVTDLVVVPPSDVAVQVYVAPGANDAGAPVQLTTPTFGSVTVKGP